ncbi:hypothetical protein BCR44DRAFT_92664 [Catenaria anguillulae PL171]|uniref:TmcB/TmcC TPR repeats domain-containing protein n=1 Tax=Catenaria anguillulae PL171 TaxID=765915 RepID=A0A1Y2HRL2_9FUNG|nr:hypothetical protein BCR44DRAFT_92664 [Catenaria anguillulae PL171]
MSMARLQGGGGPGASHLPPGMMMPTGVGQGNGVAGCDAKSTTSGKKTTELKTLLPQSMLEKTLFQLGYVLTKDNDLSPTLTWIFAILEDLQLFTFAFSSSLYPAMPSAVEAILDLFVMPLDYELFKIVNVLCICIVLSAAVLFGVVIVMMHSKNRVPITLLRVLRILCALIQTVLNIPLATILLTGLNCFYGSLPIFGTSCTSTAHMPFLVFNPLALVIFLPMLVIGALIFIEPSPSSDNPTAKPSGRHDAEAVMIRVILVVVKVYTTDRPGLPTWIFLWVGLLGLGYNSYSLLRSQPYYMARMNQFRVGMSFGGAMSMATTIVLHLILGPRNTEGWWLIMIPTSLIGIAIGAIASHFTAKYYVTRTVYFWRKLRDTATVPVPGAAGDGAVIGSLNSVVPSQTNSITSVHNLTLSTGVALMTAAPNTRTVYSSSPAGLDAPAKPKAHMKLLGPENLIAQNNSSHHFSSTSISGLSGPQSTASAAYGDPNAIASKVMAALSKDNKNARPGSTSSIARRRSTLVNSPMSTMGKPNPPSGDAKGATTDSTTRLTKRDGSSDTLNAVLERQYKPRTNVFDSPDQVELSIRYVRGYPSEKQLKVGLDILQRGLYEFPNEPQVLLVAVWYLTEFYGPEGERAADIVMRSLQEDKRSIPMSIRFQMYSRDRSQKDSGKHVLDSAALDQLMRKVKYLHLASLSAMRDMWEQIRIGSSEVAMADVVSRLAESMTGAEACYRRLLERNGKQKQLLRLYAQFLTYCACDSAKAAQILDLAEEVETMESVAHAGTGVTGGTKSVPAPTAGADGGTHIKASAVLGTVTQEGDEEHDCDVDSTKDMGAEEEDVPISNKSRLVAVDRMIASESHLLPSSSSDKNTNGPGGPMMPIRGKALQHQDIVDHNRNPVAMSGNTVAFRSANSLTQIQSPEQKGQRLPPGMDPRDKIERRPSDVNPESIIDPIEAGHTGSQTSGTSASRQQRKKQVKRRLVVERVEAPLNRTWMMASPMLFFVASVVTGFIICQRLFLDTSSFLNVQFDSARGTRRVCREIIESVRLMTFENLAGTEAGFQTALALTQKASNELVTEYLPILTKHYRLLPTAPAKRRMFLQRIVNGTTDYTPLEISPLDAVERVAQVATLATSFTQYRQLVPRVYQDLPDLGIVVNHLPDLIEMTGSIGYIYLDAYQSILSMNSTYLILCATLSIGSLLIAIGVIYQLVLHKYFEGERMVQKLLRQVPKKAASAIVTNLEEELENFREWVEGDESGDTGLDMRMSSGVSQTHSSTAANSRTRKYTLRLGAFVAVLAGLIVCMYFLTLTSLNQAADLRRMVQSADRRQWASLIRLYSREFVSPDDTMTGVSLIRLLRGTIADLTSVHEKLINDVGGLSDTLPHLTALPRVCATAAACLSGPVNPAVGYTLESAQLPLNVAVHRLVETATEVVTSMATHKTFDAFMRSPHYVKYDLVIRLCTDLMSRLGLLDAGISQMLNDRVAVSSLVTVVVFVVFLIVLAAGLMVAVVFGLAKLRRESRALTTVPFMLSQSVLQQVPELNAFLESGGLTLQINQAGDQESSGGSSNAF